MNRSSYQIQNRDFVVNSIWEGAGDELHSNDVYAASTEYGARIISGIALVSLSVARHMGDRGWALPPRASMSFESPVKSGDVIEIRSSQHSSEERIEVAVSGRLSLSIALGHDSIATPQRQEPQLTTKGRTFTSGDREVFDWWLSTSQPECKLAPPGVVPWPLLSSTVSGLIGRLDIIKDDHTSLVNRSNEWNFYRSVNIGETVHAEVAGSHERISRSKPTWGIWSAKVMVISETEGDIVGSSDWVCMYMRR